MSIRRNTRHLIAVIGLALAGSADALISDPFVNSDTAGAIVQQFNFVGAKFAEHPSLPFLYASVPATNSVAVINTQTLALVDNVFIGTNPLGLSVTPDGNRLFVSTGSDFLGVMDTTTNTKLDSIYIGSESRDVEALDNDRLLIVTGQSSPYSNTFVELQPSTEVVTNTVVSSPNSHISVYRGELQMHPDRQTVYYGNFGLSPSTLAVFDVSTPGQAVGTNISPGGGNGQDVGLSRNGEMVAYAVGGGNRVAYGYDIAIMRTSDHAILGALDTGAYPREVEFAPDAGYVYTVNGRKEIKVWSTETFLQVDTFGINGNEYYEEAQELFVTGDGRYLFSPTNEGRMLVYATGRTIVEPVVPVMGDLNGDGALTNGDISAFVLALTDEQAFAQAYPGVNPNFLGDFTGNGALTNADINGFVDALTGGGPESSPVPEPASLVLLGLGLATASRRRRQNTRALQTDPLGTY